MYKQGYFREDHPCVSNLYAGCFSESNKFQSLDLPLIQQTDHEPASGMPVAKVEISGVVILISLPISLVCSIWHIYSAVVKGSKSVTVLSFWKCIL